MSYNKNNKNRIKYFRISSKVKEELIDKIINNFNSCNLHSLEYLIPLLINQNLHL
jgi:hypothetical protein